MAGPSHNARLPQMPSLDGIRALALIAVLLFHSNFGWAKGGFLGVTSFFVLSGFLITGLLLRERETTGTIRLRAFWERRARRLAPALVVLLVLVVAYLAYGATRMPNGVVGDAIASSTWVANWRFVFADRSYAALFSGASPFEHMWSLAVEEQVYLVLPVAVLLLLGRGPTRARRGRLVLGLVAVAIASTLAAAMLHRPGATPLHEYYGTDARAAEPVVGALLAVLFVRRRGLLQLPRGARIALDGLALVAFGGLIALVGNMTQSGDALYQGGFFVAALLSAVVIAAATQPAGSVTRALAVAPLAALGRVSYGAYLFHWPIFLWLSPARTGMSGAPLLAVRGGFTFALAAVSYRLVEAPIRAGRIPIRIAIPSWANASVGLLAALALVTMSASAAPSPALFASPLTAPAPPPLARSAPPTAVAPSAPTAGLTVKSASAKGAPAIVRSAPPAAGPAPNAGSGALFAGPPPPAEPPPPAVAPAPESPPPLRVAVMGDSMAVGLGEALSAWAEARGDVVVYSLALAGCPLSRGGTRRLPSGAEWKIDPECSWWDYPTGQRSKNLRAFAPNVVVMQEGMAELPDRKLPSWPLYRHTGEPQFDRWLLTEYGALLDVVSPTDGKVLALNAVCADWVTLGKDFEDFGRGGEGDRRVGTLGSTARALASATVQVVDFQAHLCPKGRFTTTVDGVANARPDGYHLTPAAARALVDKWLGPLVLQAGGAQAASP